MAMLTLNLFSCNEYNDYNINIIDMKTNYNIKLNKLIHFVACKYDNVLTYEHKLADIISMFTWLWCCMRVHLLTSINIIEF